MSKIATSKVMRFDRTSIQETMLSPNIETSEVHSMEFVPESNWMSPMLHFLKSGELLPDTGEARNIRRKDVKCTQLSGRLYIMGKFTPMLRFLEESNITLVLTEVHEGPAVAISTGKLSPKSY